MKPQDKDAFGDPVSSEEGASISLTPTDEELAKAHANFINWLKTNPNNFSFWYSKVMDASTPSVYIPNANIIKVPDELINCFFFEKEGDADKVKAWVRDNVMPTIDTLCKDKDVFIKNGCFSNKFDFDNGCHLTPPHTLESVTKHITNIQYTSFCNDTCGNAEIVIREYIHPEEDCKTIYNGMPLRPEIRVFYDFGNHKILYAANYWEWSYCMEAISYDKTDGETYLNEYGNLTHKLRMRYAKHIDKIERFLSQVQGLDNVWSVDFILAEDKVYLIDMAAAQMSAYWDAKRVQESVEDGRCKQGASISYPKGTLIQIKENDHNCKRCPLFPCKQIIN